jgi:hypothetical protein
MKPDLSWVDRLTLKAGTHGITVTICDAVRDPDGPGDLKVTLTKWRLSAERNYSRALRQDDKAFERAVDAQIAALLRLHDEVAKA